MCIICVSCVHTKNCWKLLCRILLWPDVTRCDQHFANSAFPAAVFFQGCSMVESLCELHLAIAALRRPSDQVLILRKLMEVDGKMHDCWWPCWFLYWIALGSIQNFIPAKKSLFLSKLIVSSANPVWFSMKRETGVNGVKHAGRCSKFHSNVHVITTEFTQELPAQIIRSSWDHRIMGSLRRKCRNQVTKSITEYNIRSVSFILNKARQ